MLIWYLFYILVNLLHTHTRIYMHTQQQFIQKKSILTHFLSQNDNLYHQTTKNATQRIIDPLKTIVRYFYTPTNKDNKSNKH